MESNNILTPKCNHRYWFPGALWVELSERGNNYYNKNLTYKSSRNMSSLDIWVEPHCFIRNNGISRIYRITRALKMHVYNLRWLAKINYLVTIEHTTHSLVGAAGGLRQSLPVHLGGLCMSLLVRLCGLRSSHVSPGAYWRSPPSSTNPNFPWTEWD